MENDEKSTISSFQTKYTTDKCLILGLLLHLFSVVSAIQDLSPVFIAYFYLKVVQCCSQYSRKSLFLHPEFEYDSWHNQNNVLLRLINLSKEFIVRSRCQQKTFDLKLTARVASKSTDLNILMWKWSGSFLFWFFSHKFQ